MPTHGRATIKPIVLRRLLNGGQHCPSPSPPGFPLYQDKRLGLLTPLRYVRKPFINGSKGEEQPLPRGQGLQSRKKCKLPCLHFFLFQGGVLPLRHSVAVAGRTMPALLFVLHQALQTPPHGWCNRYNHPKTP